MKTKNFITLLFTVLTLLTVSCTNSDGSEELLLNEDNNKTMSFEDYVKYISADYSAGQVIIENNAPMGFQDNGVHYSDNLNEKTKFRIGSDVQGSTNLKSSKSLINNFGKTINYSISSESITKSSSSTELYIPEIIDASINTSQLRAGTVVSWNVDSNNENGLVVWYEYSPFNQDEFEIANNNRDRIVGGFTIPDQGGTYTVTAQDLANLPDNSFISLNLSRAGMDVNETGNGSTSVTGITSVSKEIMIQK